MKTNCHKQYDSICTHMNTLSIISKPKIFKSFNSKRIKELKEENIFDFRTI